jgi:glutathione synthase/RimK-type ligase-like ATP-grasp enzyme
MMNPDLTISPLTTGQHSLIGLAKIMRMIISGVDITTLGKQLVARAESGSAAVDANAFLDLSTILILRGEHELALSMQAQALELQQIYTPPTAAKPSALRLLALMGPGDLMANTPLELILENSNVELTLFYVSQHLPIPPSLPDHDVLFVSIGESEENIPLLQAIDTALQTWPRPVLNMPDRIALLSRDSVYSLLKSAPGVEIPETIRVSRQTLEQIGRSEVTLESQLNDGGFPIIIRPIDSHAGNGLAKLDNPAAITDYLPSMAEEEFFVSRFVNYSDADGQFRKYRIVLIEDRPYICHMGISSEWMIHYLNAGMSESAEKRAEEERVMTTFDHDFALRHKAAFHAIYTLMGLDYIGLDCAETADGKLLIFEVDGSMVIHAVDPVEIYPYKQPQMRKVFDAFEAMLVNAMKRK